MQENDEATQPGESTAAPQEGEDKALTQQEFDDLFGQYAELEKIQLAMSDAIKKAQDENSDRDAQVTRENAPVTLKEKTLWDEMRHLGFDSEAAADLKALYPDIFELKRQENEAVASIKTFEVQTFGFDHTKMSLPNVLKLIGSVVRFEIAKKKKPAHKKKK